MNLRPLKCLLAALICLTSVAHAAPEIHRPTSEPYTGDLSIFEGAKRVQNLQIDRVLDLLGIRAGSAVADIGAGGGWFSVRAARRVGANGRVYAEDINPPYVKRISERARRENLPNVRAVLGKPNDPLLPARSVDAVMLLKTYHEIAHPFRLLAHVRSAMRPGARLGIIDRIGNGADHGLDEKRVIEELRRAGFSLVAKYNFVKADGDDYFLIFK